MELGDWPTTYTWDSENRLTRVERGSGHGTTTMVYRADGLRVRKDEPSGTTKFAWDGQRLLLETDAGDATQVVYTLGPGEFGPLVSHRRGRGTGYYHLDAQGSTVGRTDAGGSVACRYVYEPYGGIASQTQSGVNPFKYVGGLGYYQDVIFEPVGPYYIRARHYDPFLARWLSGDPIKADLNLYRYCRNAAAMAADPAGVAPEGGKSYDEVFQFGRPFMQLLVTVYSAPTATEPIGTRYRWATVNELSKPDNYLLGGAKSCPATITLPANLELALAKAIEMAHSWRKEWGGLVIKRSGVYEVWGPVMTPKIGNKMIVDGVVTGSSVPTDYLIRGGGAVEVGSYHVHTIKETRWSKDDFTAIMSEGSTQTFAVMANCDGTVVRAVVTLAGESKTVRNKAKMGYKDPVLIPPRGQEAAMDLFYDSLLAKDAEELHFCSYKRETKTARAGVALTLVKYDSSLKEPK